MKIALLLNWGFGLEVLKVFHCLENIDISFVVTQFDPKSTDIWNNVVYNHSLMLGYKTISQEKLSFDKLKKEIEENEVDLLVAHAFMKIFPKSIITVPKFGCINIHASLLPKYRGASPTKLVLKNKDKITGLTTHYINEGIDTGDIIFQIKIPVTTDDTEDSIIERMKSVTKKLIIESLSRINDPTFVAIPQTILSNN